MRSPGRAITIKDVAARAGVSIKTVSRVMNDEPYVTEPVREKVLEVMRELDYRPNASARSLPGSRSYLLALLFDDPASGYASAVQSGAISRCRERGYHLVTEKVTLSSPELRSQVTQLARSLRLDGAILAPPSCDSLEIIEGLEAAGTPYVRLAPSHDEGRSSSVYIDDEAAAAEMTRYLLDLGHREIGFVEGDPAHAASKRRLAGYLSAMRAAGVEPGEGTIVEGDFSFRSGLTAGERLLANPRRPTAIFASNDDMALGVLAAAGKAGVSTPDELSIAGFDDSPTARLVWPQLTTVRQPNAEMAATAVDLLVNAASAKAAPEEPVKALLAFELMARGTTAPRRA
jgi:LacI family transcriptional regulator